MVMNILRRMAVAVLASILALSLLGLVWSHAANSTIRDKDTVKNWLEQSGLYENLVNSILDESLKSASNSQNIPLNDPRVRQIANETFGPEFVQENVEIVLDSVFGWLNGETAKPEFKIDLNDAKLKLASELETYATELASSLPPCSPEETRQLATSGGVDVFSATCLPIGVSPAQVGAELKQEVLSSDQFLSDTSFDSNDLKVDQNGQQLPLNETEQLQQIKTGYSFGLLLPYIFGLSALFSSIGIIALSSTKRRGVNRVGGALLVSGLIVGTVWFTLDRSAAWFSGKTSLVGESNLGQEVAGNILQSIRNDIGGLLLTYVAFYVLFGAGCLLVAYFYKRPKTDEVEKPKETSKPETASVGVDNSINKETPKN